MAIYHMNSSTFFKIFLDESPKKILKTQYVIASDRIRKGNRYNDNVIIGNLLLPTSGVLMSFNNDEDHKEFQSKYRSQLHGRAKTLIATLIKASIEEQYTLVILTTSMEAKFGFLKILEEWVFDVFKYPIYDYKLYKEGKQEIQSFNPAYTLDQCKNIMKKAKSNNMKQSLSSTDGRKRLAKKMSKKEKIKELKK